MVGERAFTWDEQNRLLAVKDNRGASISHYVYDHTGERTFKSEGGISQANIRGQQIYEVEDIYNYTIYPSGNMVVSPNKDQYTKHYYSNGKDGNIPYNGNKAPKEGQPSRYILTEVRNNE